MINLKIPVSTKVYNVGTVQKDDQFSLTDETIEDQFLRSTRELRVISETDISFISRPKTGAGHCVTISKWHYGDLVKQLLDTIEKPLIRKAKLRKRTEFLRNNRVVRFKRGVHRWFNRQLGIKGIEKTPAEITEVVRNATKKQITYAESLVDMGYPVPEAFK